MFSRNKPPDLAATLAKACGEQPYFFTQVVPDNTNFLLHRVQVAAPAPFPLTQVHRSHPRGQRHCPISGDFLKEQETEGISMQRRL